MAPQQVSGQLPVVNEPVAGVRAVYDRFREGQAGPLAGVMHASNVLIEPDAPPPGKSVTGPARIAREHDSSLTEFYLDATVSFGTFLNYAAPCG